MFNTKFINKLNVFLSININNKKMFWKKMKKKIMIIKFSLINLLSKHAY